MSAHPKTTSRRAFLGLVSAGLALPACGGGGEDNTAAAGGDSPAPAASTDGAAPQGLRLVSAQDGAAIQNDPPQDLVILDVRTPEEFAEGHLEGAIMVNCWDADFEAQLAELDPDVPFLLYCNSGNRSGQTVPILESLGFTDVADVDGGIQAWYGAGLPTVTP